MFPDTHFFNILVIRVIHKKGACDGAVPQIPFNARSVAKTPVQHIKCLVEHLEMFAFAISIDKLPGNLLDWAGVAHDVHQIGRILVFRPVVERESLESNKFWQVGKSNGLGSDPFRVPKPRSNVTSARSHESVYPAS